MGLIHGSGRSPGGGHGNQLQYSCLENLMNRGECSPWGHRELGTTEATMHINAQGTQLVSKNCCMCGYSPWSHKELDTTERLASFHKVIGNRVTADDVKKKKTD